MNIVIMGGNGYIGRNVAWTWLAYDADAQVYAQCRSGKNTLEHERLHTVKADCMDIDQVRAASPDQVDFILDLIGSEDDMEANRKPAQIMQAIAEEKNCFAMGYVGASMGGSELVQTTTDIVRDLRESDVPLIASQPTLVYGSDCGEVTNSRAQKLLKTGKFFKSKRPVHIDDVVVELIGGLMSYYVPFQSAMKADA